MQYKPGKKGTNETKQKTKTKTKQKKLRQMVAGYNHSRIHSRGGHELEHVNARTASVPPCLAQNATNKGRADRFLSKVVYMRASSCGVSLCNTHAALLCISRDVLNNAWAAEDVLQVRVCTAFELCRVCKHIIFTLSRADIE